MQGAYQLWETFCVWSLLLLIQDSIQRIDQMGQEARLKKLQCLWKQTFVSFQRLSLARWAFSQGDNETSLPNSAQWHHISTQTRVTFHCWTYFNAFPRKLLGWTEPQSHQLQSLREEHPWAAFLRREIHSFLELWKRRGLFVDVRYPFMDTLSMLGNTFLEHFSPFSARTVPPKKFQLLPSGEGSILLFDCCLGINLFFFQPLIAAAWKLQHIAPTCARNSSFGRHLCVMGEDTHLRCLDEGLFQQRWLLVQIHSAPFCHPKQLLQTTQIFVQICVCVPNALWFRLDCLGALHVTCATWFRSVHTITEDNYCSKGQTHPVSDFRFQPPRLWLFVVWSKNYLEDFIGTAPLKSSES